MKTCSKCGKEVDGAKFCPECGTAIDAPAAEVEPAEEDEPKAVPVAQPFAPAKQAKEAKKKEKMGKGKKIAIAIGVVFILGMFGMCSDNGTENTGAGSSSSETSSQVEKEEPKETKPVVDKTALETEISVAESIDGSIYTEESYAALTAAVEAGKAVVADENATQKEVDKAIKAIEEANLALEVPFVFDPANYESISYTDIARNPDSYIGYKVTFSGKVLQVMEGSGEIDLRVATDGGYDNVVLAAYGTDLLDFRVLEDDQIKIYGTCLGLYTYTSTLGAEISIPAIYCDQVELA